MPSAEQIKEVERQKKYSNIPAWHAAGITGKGVNVMNLESTPHGTKSCTERFLDAAPDAKIYATGLTFADGVATCKYDGKIYAAEDFIREFEIKILIRSTGGPLIDEEKSKYWNALKEKYNLIFVTPIGNNKVTSAFPADVAIQVGACSISDKGTINVLNFSGKSEYLELVNFMGYLNGTSFSGPYTAGMIALLVQAFGDITQDEAFEYLKSHCKDLGKTGRDDESGYGIPIMGDPKEGELMIKEFIEKIGPMAQADMAKSKILASLTIAQGCLESKYGKSGLTKRAGNLFGIKGKYQGQSIMASTKEFVNGQWITIQAEFRKYPSWAESIADHSAIFNRMSRYTNLRGLKDYKLACRYVQKDGYATDPDYADKLVEIIEQYDLTRFDKEDEVETDKIKVLMNGKETELTTILYKNENYMRIRDLANAQSDDKLTVDYDTQKKQVIINSK